MDIYGDPKHSRQALLAELKACGITKNLQRGQNLHAEAIQNGNDSCIYVRNSLVSMYAKCGAMSDARQVFDSTSHPSVVSWNALILGYAENGEGRNALDLFAIMRSQGCTPNSVTCIAAVKACISWVLQEDGGAKCLELGRHVHSLIGHTANFYVQSSLIDMYAKCHSMADAEKVFNTMQYQDVVSWNALIMGYAENGKGDIALDMFTKMKSECCIPDSITFVAALKACASLGLEQYGKESLHLGKQIHLLIGCHMNIYVQNTLVDMYAKCGSMVDALQVFESINQPDVVSWNAIITGYVENGEAVHALDFFAKMHFRGCLPDSITFSAALKACTCLVDVVGMPECKRRGKQIHSLISRHSTSNAQNTLIGMYAKCGSMLDALHVFNTMNKPDVVAWNSLILGYAENREGFRALQLFARMRSLGCVPNSITFTAALKACISLALDETGRAECLERGKQIHAEIGCHSNDCIEGTLIDMYSKCRNMVEARKVFDSIKHPDIVSWTALMLGYVENGEPVTALHLYSRIRSENSTPNSRTFSVALKACGLLGALASGKKIHSEISATTKTCNGILVSCLVDFYAKCGSMLEAQDVFDLYPRTRDVKTWTALLGGYSRLGDSKAVFGVFEKMKDAGVQPNGITFICILTCCTHAGLVEKAQEFFKAMSTVYGIVSTVEHYTCMVDILGRSNMLDGCMALLRSMTFGPDAVAWMTVLGGCCKWKNVGIGRVAFQSLVSLDNTNAAAYVQMAHIFGTRGMLREQKMILEMRNTLGAWKDRGQSIWTNEVDEVSIFRVEDIC